MNNDTKHYYWGQTNFKIGDIVTWHRSAGMDTTTGKIVYIGRDNIPVVETLAGRTVIPNAAFISHLSRMTLKYELVVDLESFETKTQAWNNGFSYAIEKQKNWLRKKIEALRGEGGASDARDYYDHGYDKACNDILTLITTPSQTTIEETKIRLHPNDCPHKNTREAGRGDWYCLDCQTYR